MTILRWRNPKIYGLLGFILVAVPMLFFFFAGMPYTEASSTVIGSREYSATETVWEGAFNPVFLYFVIGAAVAAWGCNRNKTLSWVGSLFVLFLSILALFSIGLFTLPGAVLLVTGAALKTFNRGT
jgi:protein-S-isoprenylcysteine O-methyltransferase Ste14